MQIWQFFKPIQQLLKCAALKEMCKNSAFFDCWWSDDSGKEKPSSFRCQSQIWQISSSSFKCAFEISKAMQAKPWIESNLPKWNENCIHQQIQKAQCSSSVTLGVNYTRKFLHIFKSILYWIYNNLKLQYTDLQQNCIYLVTIYKNSNLLYFNLMFHIWIYYEDNLQYLNLP